MRPVPLGSGCPQRSAASPGAPGTGNTGCPAQRPKQPWRPCLSSGAQESGDLGAQPEWAGGSCCQNGSRSHWLDHHKSWRFRPPFSEVVERGQGADPRDRQSPSLWEPEGTEAPGAAANARTWPGALAPGSADGPCGVSFPALLPAQLSSCGIRASSTPVLP